MFAERKQAEKWQIIYLPNSALADPGRGWSDSQFLSFQKVQKGTIAANPLQGVDLCFLICQGALSPAYKPSILCCLLLSILCPSTFLLFSLLPSFSPLPSLLLPNFFPLSPRPHSLFLSLFPGPHPGLSLFLMKNPGDSCWKRHSTQHSAHPSTVL